MTSVFLLECYKAVQEKHRSEIYEFCHEFYGPVGAFLDQPKNHEDKDLFDLATSYIPDKFLNSFVFVPKDESPRNFVPGQLEFRNQVVKCWLREELFDFTGEKPKPRITPLPCIAKRPLCITKHKLKLYEQRAINYSVYVHGGDAEKALTCPLPKGVETVATVLQKNSPPVPKAILHCLVEEAGLDFICIKGERPDDMLNSADFCYETDMDKYNDDFVFSSAGESDGSNGSDDGNDDSSDLRGDSSWSHNGDNTSSSDSPRPPTLTCPISSAPAGASTNTSSMEQGDCAASFGVLSTFATAANRGLTSSPLLIPVAQDPTSVSVLKNHPPQGESLFCLPGRAKRLEAPNNMINKSAPPTKKKKGRPSSARNWTFKECAKLVQKFKEVKPNQDKLDDPAWKVLLSSMVSAGYAERTSSAYKEQFYGKIRRGRIQVAAGGSDQERRRLTAEAEMVARDLAKFYNPGINSSEYTKENNANRGPLKKLASKETRETSVSDRELRDLLHKKLLADDETPTQTDHSKEEMVALKHDVRRIQRTSEAFQKETKKNLADTTKQIKSLSEQSIAIMKGIEGLKAMMQEQSI